MTNGVIDDSKIILFDNWPGVPSLVDGVPSDGFTGADHHNVAAAKYPVGTKIRVYDETNKGYATFIYLQYNEGTKAAVYALAAKQFVAIDTNLAATGATSSGWYKVTDDGSEALLGGPVAVALSAMTTTYYGWFWCGGVCPVGWVPALNGDFVTDGSIEAGGRFCGAANASLASLYSDMIILAHVALATATNLVIPYEAGIAMIADT